MARPPRVEAETYGFAEAGVQIAYAADSASARR